MTETRRVLFVLGCVVCLIAVASALPAADPRLDVPGATGNDAVAGEWESIADTQPFTVEELETGEDDEDDEDDAPYHDIEISGSLEPGSEVTVETDDMGHFSSDTIEVNGEEAGQTDSFGRVDVEVPYAEEMNVSVAGDRTSRTVEVETNASIEKRNGPAPTGELAIAAAVGSTPVPDATVTVDGEPAATTDEKGHATVELPPSAGPVEIGVERDPVAGERTIDVPEPTVEFASSALFPGFPAPVMASADGTPVENATVELEGDSGTATTGDDGRATVWLPIDDEVTVTATVGEESTTASVGNLYLRLTAVVVLVPGLAIGGFVTYVRLVARSERRRGRGLVWTFVALADVLEGLSGAIGRLFDALGNWTRSAASISWPSLSRPGGGFRFPAVGSALASLSIGAASGTLSSLGSQLFGGRSSEGRDRSTTDRPSITDWLGGDDEDENEDADGNAVADSDASPALADEPIEPRSPREEILAAWHAFLDRLEVRNRETTTPGAAGRRALEAGFPADRVRRLVGIVRDVEYGGRTPSADRVVTARETATDLAELEATDEEDADGGSSDDDSDEVTDE